MDVDFLQKICMALPGVTQDIKWGNDLVFSIGNKMFCVSSMDPPFKCSFKVPDEDFEELSNQEGFIPAAYMARAKWITVINPVKLKRKEWENFIHVSYELVKSK